jgi:hypothetical protein
MNNKVVFSPCGYSDGMNVIMPSGESVYCEGDGIIDFIAKKFKYGHISQVVICGFGESISKREIFEIKQTTGAEVFICDKE